MFDDQRVWYKLVEQGSPKAILNRQAMILPTYLDWEQFDRLLLKLPFFLITYLYTKHVPTYKISILQMTTNSLNNENKKKTTQMSSKSPYIFLVFLFSKNHILIYTFT